MLFDVRIGFRPSFEIAFRYSIDYVFDKIDSFGYPMFLLYSVKEAPPNSGGAVLSAYCILVGWWWK